MDQKGKNREKEALKEEGGVIPLRKEKEEEEPSPRAIAQFVMAYLQTLPPRERKEIRSALKGISLWMERAIIEREIKLSVLLEAGTILCKELGYPPGEFLALLTQEWKEERKALKPQTQRRILRSAYEVFAEKGFFLATVEDIALRAQVGKGTIYRYYQSKDNLFRAVVEEELKELGERIRNPFIQAEDILTAIRRGIYEYLKFFEEKKEFYRILIFEQQGFGQEFRVRYINNILEQVPMIREKVLQGAKEGILKPLDDFYTVFYGLVGFVDGVIMKWFYNHCQGNLVDELDTIIEVLLYGFARNGRLPIPVPQPPKE